MRARLLLAFLSCTLLPACWAAALDPPCPRAEPGSFVTQPQDLYSRHGQLEVRFSYRTRVDSAGKILYCFTDQDGHQSPTLHVRPGDHLKIHLKNELTPNGVQPSMQAMPQMAVMVGGADVCAAMTMSDSSVNIHYHGLNIPPTCHQDEVLKTVVNVGESFDYDLAFPRDEPPGLYWYHPHIHGIAEPAVLGGASGAIVVEGLENVNPAVAGLRQRVLVVRDNELPGNLESDEEAPAWDVSVNYVPVPYPLFTPARLEVAPEKRELWRVLNACADTILDLELEYDGISQPLQVVGLDGVPVGSQEGLRPGRSVLLRHVLLPPAGRAEFIVTGPPRFVHSAILQTRDVYTGPAGDADPGRPLLAIEPGFHHEAEAQFVPLPSGERALSRFRGLSDAKPSTARKLYFSEVFSVPGDPESPTNFFITVDGQKPALFDPANPPAIVTRQGAVEEWTVENRTQETHVFHIHQIHFLLEEQNGVRVRDPQFLDTVNVPYWSGTGPYPSVKLRMDFRGPIVGDFVYHCHILEHEDKGMMATIRVLPAERK